jgi:hypothetical protein
MSEAQRTGLMGQFREFTQAIVQSGHFRSGAPLQPTQTATTVREKGGKVLTTDGPYVETKEQLGGYYLVECKDLDEAIALAARIPTVHVGGAIEVRPVMPTSRM